MAQLTGPITLSVQLKTNLAPLKSIVIFEQGI